MLPVRFNEVTASKQLDLPYEGWWFAVLGSVYYHCVMMISILPTCPASLVTVTIAVSVTV